MPGHCENLMRLWRSQSSFMLKQCGKRITVFLGKMPNCSYLPEPRKAWTWICGWCLLIPTSRIPTIDAEMNKLSESTESDRCDPIMTQRDTELKLWLGQDKELHLSQASVSFLFPAHFWLWNMTVTGQYNYLSASKVSQIFPRVKYRQEPRLSGHLCSSSMLNKSVDPSQGQSMFSKHLSLGDAN